VTGSDPVILAFATRSSEVAQPVHMAKLEAMGVPNRIVSVVLPLGYAFNRDASMVYFALAVTFLADAYRVPLNGSALLTIFITTAIASKGTANVPSGGLVAVAMVMTIVGLPVESLAIIAGVDAFMDMGRSAINDLGNTVAVMLVRKFGGAAAAVEATLPSPADAPQPGRTRHWPIVQFSVLTASAVISRISGIVSTRRTASIIAVARSAGKRAASAQPRNFSATSA
jgi:Na+/H+-dicarboxylate symporter